MTYDETRESVIEPAVPFGLSVRSHLAGVRILLFESDVLDGEREDEGNESEVASSWILAKPRHSRIFLRSAWPTAAAGE